MFHKIKIAFLNIFKLFYVFTKDQTSIKKKDRDSECTPLRLIDSRSIPFNPEILDFFVTINLTTDGHLPKKRSQKLRVTPGKYLENLNFHLK
jgi:hypothetical protein